MYCPFCKSSKSIVIDTTHTAQGDIHRRRECRECGSRFSTYERFSLATPLIVKQDGSREEFDREKLIRSIRFSCGKRPIPSSDLERLAGNIEVDLQKLGKKEVPSKLVGDMAMKHLEELDVIAYIRYAMIYLKLNDVTAVLKEVDRMLEKQKK